MLRFSKFSGAGNDFVVVDAGEIDPRRASNLARAMCDRSSGPGADGLILVGPSGHGLSARFFNPDGTEFSICGNGTRCAARYGRARGWVGDAPFDIATAVGAVRATLAGEGVGLDYAVRIRVEREVRLRGIQGEERGWLVDIGLPHFVVPVERLPADSIDDRCAVIRRHPEFGTEGTNVNLVELADERSGRIRTFERGVEGETLACGSGAMASVVALHFAGLCGPSVHLDVRSGDHLSVSFAPFGRAARGPEPPVRLTGPVEHLCDGEFRAQAAGSDPA